MKNFRDLEIWQRSHHLTITIYKTTSLFPKHELYGLVSQIRRASSSIPTNIAEGCGRGSERDFARFLQIAIGSASEVEYELILAKDLRYLSEDEYHVLLNELVVIRKMIISLMKRIRL